MKRFSLLIVCMAVLATATLMPARSEARVFVGIGLGGCCYYGPGWGYPYYGYYYPPAYSSYYTPYAPPVAAAPSTTVIYNTPPASAPAPVAATQTSTTFTDSFGRTCRHFQTSAGGAPATGTACMQTDGTWKVVQ